MKQDQYLSHCISGLFGSVLFSLATLVYANPGGPQIVHGQVTMSHPDPATLNIRNSPNAIINWKSFSIGKGETTRFIQQNASSAILNRVRGENPSALLGRMSSNGRVFLINPNGMVFGPNAVIDTAGFIGSTLNIKDDDFLAGRLNFEGAPGAGSIKNQGLIQARDDGGVYLIAPSIENSGIISTESGNLVLAAGRKITISSLDLEHISVEIQAPEDEVVNIGKLLTSGGAMGVFAGTIRNHGHIEADTLTRDAQGNIRLVAQADIELESGSTISASGPRGGRIQLESKTGTTQVSGAVAARGRVENGGAVQVLGEHVALNNTSSVDVSGENGGGTVLVGGDYRGQGEVRNATTTYVGPEATIDASAQTEGDGGKVIVWADDSTRYYGDITVRGGTHGGDGGFVEVSGKKNLGFDGTVDASAPEGNVGTLLLDPQDIIIFDNTLSTPIETNDSELEPDVPNPGDPPGQIRADDSPDASFFISEAALESLPENTNVILEATNNITIQNMSDLILDLKTTSDGSVTFTADADLSGAGNFLSAGQNTIQTHGGAITIEGAGIVAGNIDTNGPSDAESINGGEVTITSTGEFDPEFETGEISIGNIDTSSTVGNGGDIIISETKSISPNNGFITTGNIDASSTAGDGGNIIITSGTNIVTEDLTSSGSSQAGDISLDSSNGSIGVVKTIGEITEAADIDATSINGTGGNISLAADAFLVIGGTDTDTVASGSSISASGGTKSGDIILTGSQIFLSGSNIQSDGGNLLLQPSSTGQNIIFAGQGENEGVLDITTGDLDSLADDFNTVTIGRDDGLGVLTIAPNEITFNNHFIFQSSGAGGSIEGIGPVLTDGSDLEMIAGDSIALQGNIETQGGDINLFSTGDINGLNLNASSDSSTGGSVTISSNGDTKLIIGNIDTSSAASDGGDITISAVGTIATGDLVSRGASQAGNISLNSTGLISPTLGASIVDATSINGAGGNISLTADLFLDLAQGSSISASGGTKSGDITLTGNEINLTGSNVQSDGGNLLLQPALDTQNVIVAGTTDNEDILDITTGDLDSLADNFNTVTIGRDDGLGVLTIAPNEITFNNQLVFQSPGASGRIEAAGSVLTDGSDLEMIAGDSIALQGDIETQGGDINLFSTGNINGLNLNASSDSSTGGDMSINGNQIGLSGTVQTKSADITLTASEMNLTGFVESSGPEGNISVNGPVQTSGNDLKMTAGDNIAITEDIISSGGNIDLSSTNIGLVTATLDSTNPDSGSGAINVAPTAGGSINIDNSTLITDSLTLGGPVAGTSSLTLLPATTGMDIDIGSTTPGSLLSIDNIGNLSEFSGHLSVGGTIAPPASSTQVKAGDMTVVSDFSMKGDLTLVSLGDITLNADGSLQSGGTLTLAALGDFIPGSPGNISDTSISEARLFFDAPEVVFFANNEAGTLENPLTVKSGANTVNAGAGTGVAYFDGAPGNIIGSGPVIQSLFNSLQAIDINLDNDILNTRVVDLSVPPSPAPPPPEPSPTELVPPTSYPQPYLFPFREPDIAKSATSRWNSEVNQVAMLDQWLELGPMFRNVVDMSRFNMDVLMAPSSTMVMSFRSDNNSINIGTTLAGDNMPTQPLQAQLTTASDGSIVAAIDMPDNLGATSGEVAMVNISIDVTDSSGNPAPIRISRIGLLPNTNTPGHTEADLREFGYEITNISFGPPEIIRPSDGQDTNYSFYSRAEFKRASVDFWRINPSRQHISENVDQQLIPERIRKGVWIGKDGSRHWSGLNWKEQPSIGQHELQIKAWNREGILWYIGRSDSRVTVSNED